MYTNLIQNVKEDAEYFRAQGFDILAKKFEEIYAALVSLTISQKEETKNE